MRSLGCWQPRGFRRSRRYKTATINAAAALGPLGEGLGSIAPGKVADVIAMQVDPLLHIDEVGEPGKVVFVMKDGKVLKDEHSRGTVTLRRGFDGLPWGVERHLRTERILKCLRHSTRQQRNGTCRQRTRTKRRLRLII